MDFEDFLRELEEGSAVAATEKQSAFILDSQPVKPLPSGIDRRGAAEREELSQVTTLPDKENESATGDCSTQRDKPCPLVSSVDDSLESDDQWNESLFLKLAEEVGETTNESSNSEPKMDVSRNSSSNQNISPPQSMGASTVPKKETMDVGDLLNMLKDFEEDKSSSLKLSLQSPTSKETRGHNQQSLMSLGFSSPPFLHSNSINGTHATPLQSKISARKSVVSRQNSSTSSAGTGEEVTPLTSPTGEAVSASEFLSSMQPGRAEVNARPNVLSIKSGSSSSGDNEAQKERPKRAVHMPGSIGAINAILQGGSSKAAGETEQRMPPLQPTRRLRHNRNNINATSEKNKVKYRYSKKDFIRVLMSDPHRMCIEKPRLATELSSHLTHTLQLGTPMTAINIVHELKRDWHETAAGNQHDNKCYLRNVTHVV